MHSLFINKSLKDYFFIFLFLVFLTLVIWIPYFLKLDNFFGLQFTQGFETIYKNYDGLEYVVVAKTFYDPQAISAIPQQLEPLYYASRFPLFPLFIFGASTLFGYLKSMLIITQIFTFLSGVVFYRLVKDFELSKKPLLLTFIFLLLPARWVIVHSIGSSEPVFIFFVISCLYYFLKYEKHAGWDNISLAALFGTLAQLTRPPGILLFIALGLYIVWKAFRTKRILSIFRYSPLLLIPFSLISTFYLYSLTYGDFFAYFNSGDNIHLQLPPFQVFNKNQPWVGDIWLEDIIYIFLLGFSAAFLLIKQRLYPMAFFVFTFLTASILIAHRDISRYTLPVIPFVLIAFEKFLTSSEFKIVLIILGLAIYLYSQNFILMNVAPIPNLYPFD